MKRYLYILLIIFTLLPLSCQEDSVEQLNRSPEIIALSAQYDSVKTLTTSLVTCRAIDPDGDSLVYWWHTAATIISDSGSSILIESPRMSCILPIACTVFDQNGGSNSDTIYVTVYGHHHQQIYTLYHKIEAQEIALWAGKTLNYSESDYYEILWSLNEIRRIFSSEFPFLDNLRFQLPWEEGKIIIKTDSSTADLIKNNQYGGWDSLDENLHPFWINPLSSGNYFLLGVFENYNPWKLCDIYSLLPGIIIAEPNFLGPPVIPGFYPIIPVIIDEGMGYVFNLNYYFEIRGETAEFIGKLPYSGDQKPQWVLNAEFYIQNFSYWGKQ